MCKSSTITNRPVDFKFPVAICGSITRTRHDRVRKENFLSATKWSLGSAVHRQHFESHKLAVVGMALYDFRVILVTREFRTMSCPVFFPGMSFVLVTILSEIGIVLRISFHRCKRIYVLCEIYCL